MAEKKSLRLAKATAMEQSRKTPGVLFRVMDKSGKSAVCTASDFVYRERVLAGWHTVIAFRNGEEAKS